MGSEQSISWENQAPLRHVGELEAQGSEEGRAPSRLDPKQVAQ